MDEFTRSMTQTTERYRAAGCWRGDHLGDLLRDWASADPGRTALVAGRRRLTYGELDCRADRLAAGLQSIGMERGERVIVQLPNGPEFLALAIALFRLAAVPVFALPSLGKLEIAQLCELTEARFYFIPGRNLRMDYIAMARELLASSATLAQVLVAGESGPFRSLDSVDANPVPLRPPDPSEPAFLLLSGGTTATPKLIPRTHEDYSCQLRVAAERMGADERTVYLAALPMAHNAALGCPGALGTLRVGGKVVLAPSPSAAEAFSLIEQEGVNLTTLISPLAALWLEAARISGKRFPSLTLELGGAMLDPALGEELLSSLGCTLSHWFGMAEGVHCCTRPSDSHEVVIHTQGTPLCALDDLRVVDEGGRDVARGEVGQLLARGPCTLRGYYGAPEHNAVAFTRDGYLRTGDLVRIRGDGNLVVEGRLSNSINRGGEKISAEELEGHLTAHPYVEQAVVVPVPDDILGERTCAYVVMKSARTATLPQFDAFFAERGLAPFKRLDDLRIVRSLPLTGMGKVDRAAVRRAMTVGRSALA